jgi:hypothetical protein
VEWRVPFLMCLIEIEPSGVVHQKRTSSTDAEATGLKKSHKPTRSCLLLSHSPQPFPPHRHEQPPRTYELRVTPCVSNPYDYINHVFKRP